MSGFFGDNPTDTVVGSTDATESTISEDAVTQTDTAGGFYQGSPDQTTTDAYTADALASKSAAATSESNAATSESNAATSESNAATSATNSATSESSVSNNASAAAQSASQALSSKNASVVAKGAAETAETNSANSATASANSATASAASATASANSATASESSKVTSTTKASEASTSASTAATKAADAETARAASVVAKDASVVAKNESVAAKVLSVAAKDASVVAQNAAVTAQNNSSASAQTATTKASEASTSAGTATTKASQAATSATASESSKVASVAAKDAALAALDSFDDRYLGSKSSAPTVDNDGDALASGMLYFNTTTDEMKVYDGSQWLNAYASLSGALLATSNLADLNNAGTARTNLGLGTAATTAASAYATAAQGTKVDGIEASATADQTNAEIRAAVEAASDSHVFTDADHTKLNAIATGATNVTNNNQLTNGAGYVTTDTNTTYTVGDGGLTQINFTSADNTKLDGIATNANNYVLPFTNNSTNWNTAYTYSQVGHLPLSGGTLTGTLSGTTAQFANVGIGASPNSHGLYVYHTDNFEAAKFQTNLGGSLARFTDTTASIEIGVQSGKPVIRTGNTARLTVDGANLDINSGALKMAGTTVIDSSRNLTNIGTLNGGTAWRSNNDGSGSGLDADLLDGKHASDFVEHMDGTRTNAANLNWYLASGFYNVGAATIANKPSGASDYGQLIVAKGIDTGLQIYGGFSNPTLYVRGWASSGTFYGWRKLWNDSNDGSGSGLDADTVDGIQGASFLRSDATDTASGAVTFSAATIYMAGNLAHHGDTNTYMGFHAADQWRVVTGGSERLEVNNSAVTVAGTLNANYLRADRLYSNNDGSSGYFFNDSSTRTAYTGGDFYIQSAVGNYYNYATNQYLGNTSGDTIRLRGNSMVHNGFNFNSSGDLSTSRDIVSSARNRGVFGSYSSTKTDQIWSMGTSYRNHASGTNFGNLYGLAYKHTNNSTGGTMGGSHMVVWCQNGTPYVSLGSNIWAKNNITAYSDSRVKTNLEKIPNALDKVSSINGYTYNRTDLEDEDTDVRHAGVIAQEVLQVLPEVVTGGPTEDDPDGHYSVAYGNLTALLIESIKELKAEVDDLKKQLEAK